MRVVEQDLVGYLIYFDTTRGVVPTLYIFIPGRQNLKHQVKASFKSLLFAEICSSALVSVSSWTEDIIDNIFPIFIAIH